MEGEEPWPANSRAVTLPPIGLGPHESMSLQLGCRLTKGPHSGVACWAEPTLFPKDCEGCNTGTHCQMAEGERRALR